MVLTASNMLALGTDAPDFDLPNVSNGNLVKLADVKALHPKGLVVAFICNHCPYVQHIFRQLADIGNEYTNKGIQFVAICANDAVNYPEDAPDKMKQIADEMGFQFPYLYDQNQAVAKAYHAACTPDFYLFDSLFKLVYRGQFDDARPGKDTPVTGASLVEAMVALMEGRRIDSDHQKPSMGCSIKWAQ